MYQEKGGYCYNSDTLFLYDFIAKKGLKGDVLDVGCGCGVLGLLLKERFDIKLTGIDIQKNNIFLSNINAKNNNLEAEFLEGDFLEYSFEKKFDTIVSNPPFYKTQAIQSKNFSKKISRFSDSLPLRSFIKKSNSLLKPKGEVFFCYDASIVDEVLSVLLEYKIKPELIRFVFPKREKGATIVLIKAKKSSKTPVKHLFPLVTHEDGEFTKEVQEIYKAINLKSLKCDL